MDFSYGASSSSSSNSNVVQENLEEVLDDSSSSSCCDSDDEGQLVAMLNYFFEDSDSNDSCPENINSDHDDDDESDDSLNFSFESIESAIFSDESDRAEIPIVEPELPSNKQCGLRFVHPCNWSGPYVHDMVFHCLEQHSRNTFVSFGKNEIVSKLDERRPQLYVILIYQLDRLFRLTWDLDMTANVMRFGVYILYDEISEEGDYVFDIDFLCGDENVVKMNGPCLSLANDDELYQADNYFTVPYELVKKYCVVENILRFTVSISHGEMDESLLS